MGINYFPGASGTLIAETTLGATASAITFDSIPQTYKDLRLVVVGTVVGTVSGGIRFNNDATANYDNQNMRAQASSVTAAESFADTRLLVGTLVSSVVSSFDVLIPDYTNTAFDKTAHVHSGAKRGTSTSNLSVDIRQGWWRSSAAITRVDVSFVSMAAGTVARLYGSK